MNILLCNYRYFVSGGTERYLFNLTRILESKGHTVVPFSMQYKKNEPTPFSRYFALSPSGPDHVQFDDSELRLSKKLRLFSALLYNQEAKRKIKTIIRQEKIDIVHTIQIVNYLYPSVIDGCREMGVPVAFMAQDFQLLCPSYNFFCRGRICEKCKDGYFNAVRNRCLKNSYSLSLAKVFAMYLHRYLKVNEKISAFLAVSEFLKNKMIEYGFDRSRVYHIPLPIDVDALKPCSENKGYILYMRGINEMRGIEVLVGAFKALDRPVRLKIAGEAHDNESRRLKKRMLDENINNVEFVGFKPVQEIEELYRGAIFCVVPSLGYETGAHFTLEAMASGKPVLGTRVGANPEFIDEGVDGLLCKPGDIGDLCDKMRYFIDNPRVTIQMGKDARKKIEERYTSEIHYQSLLEIYNSVLS